MVKTSFQGWTVGRALLLSMILNKPVKQDDIQKTKYHFYEKSGCTITITYSCKNWKLLESKNKYLFIFLSDMEYYIEKQELSYWQEVFLLFLLINPEFPRSPSFLLPAIFSILS